MTPEMQLVELQHLIHRFETATDQFARAIDKLQTIEGMKAENESRKDRGLSQAYGEEAFINVG